MNSHCRVLPRIVVRRGSEVPALNRAAFRLAQRPTSITLIEVLSKVNQKDRGPVELSAAQCRGARAMLGISQTELAEAASVSRQTIVDFERGARTPYANNLSAIRKALEAAGVEFIPQNGGGHGVRLKD